MRKRISREKVLITGLILKRWDRGVLIRPFNLIKINIGPINLILRDHHIILREILFKVGAWCLVEEEVALWCLEEAEVVHLQWYLMEEMKTLMREGDIPDLTLRDLFSKSLLKDSSVALINLHLDMHHLMDLKMHLIEVTWETDQWLEEALHPGQHLKEDLYLLSQVDKRTLLINIPETVLEVLACCHLQWLSGLRGLQLKELHLSVLLPKISSTHVKVPTTTTLSLCLLALPRLEIQLVQPVSEFELNDPYYTNMFLSLQGATT